MSAGSRPFIYKQGPGDPPQTIEEKAGVVTKREEPRVAAAPARPATPAPAAPAQRAAPAVAQAPATAPAPAAAAAVPMAAEPLGSYTQASRYGDLLFISGQIGNDVRTGAFNAGQDIDAQTRQVMENLRAILENNRLTMANVVSVTVYLANINQLANVDRVYHGFFKGTPPARSVVEVARLPRGALVEISVVAGR